MFKLKYYAKLIKFLNLPFYLSCHTFKSYSFDRPCTVVNVFLPFLCWIRTCTNPSCTPSSSPFAASAKGSNPLRFSILDITQKFIKMSLMIKAQFTTQVYYDFDSVSTDEVRAFCNEKELFRNKRNS